MGYQARGGRERGEAGWLNGSFPYGSARLVPFKVEASAGPHGRACAWSVRMDRLVAFAFSCLVQRLDVCYHVFVARLLVCCCCCCCCSSCTVPVPCPPLLRLRREGILMRGSMGERSATQHSHVSKAPESTEKGAPLPPGGVPACALDSHFTLVSHMYGCYPFPAPGDGRTGTPPTRLSL